MHSTINIDMQIIHLVCGPLIQSRIKNIENLWLQLENLKNVASNQDILRNI